MTETDRDRDAIAERLADLLARAGLEPSAEDMEKLLGLVMENRLSGERVRRLVSRYDEPANALPTRRRIRGRS